MLYTIWKVLIIRSIDRSRLIGVKITKSWIYRRPKSTGQNYRGPKWLYTYRRNQWYSSKYLNKGNWKSRREKVGYFVNHIQYKQLSCLLIFLWRLLLNACVGVYSVSAPNLARDRSKISSSFFIDSVILAPGNFGLW